MKREFSLLRITAWAIIGLWLARSILFNILNIDFASLEIAKNFRIIWLILIPLSVGILFAKSWKSKKPTKEEVIRLSVGIVISAGLIIVMNFCSSFCGWRFSDPMYKHKSENTEIRERILDCGAWDSDPTHQLVESYSIGNYLIKYSEIKEENIDPDAWIKE